LARALKLAGEVVRQEAATTAPRDRGDLAKNIIVRAARGGQATGASVQIGPSSKVFYGLFTEIGTKHVRPQRWLTRAFDTSAEQALHVLGVALGKEIEQAAEKLAGPYAKSGARPPGRFRL
jgi:HK97 gp10 family phage protein